jgi:hypothetical protein
VARWGYDGIDDIQEEPVQYALLIYNEPDTRAEVGPDPEGAFDDWASYFTAARDAGVFVAAEGLRDADTATTVRMSAGQLLLTDGPYVETKEHLLGFYLIDVPNLDAAIEWASRMPVLRRGAVEIRPLLPSSETSMLVGRAQRRSID